jgi:hypothetical protein
MNKKLNSSYLGKRIHLTQQIQLVQTLLANETSPNGTKQKTLKLDMIKTLQDRLASLKKSRDIINLTFKQAKAELLIAQADASIKEFSKVDDNILLDEIKELKEKPVSLKGIMYQPKKEEKKEKEIDEKFITNLENQIIKVESTNEIINHVLSKVESSIKIMVEAKIQKIFIDTKKNEENLKNEKDKGDFFSYKSAFTTNSLFKRSFIISAPITQMFKKLIKDEGLLQQECLSQALYDYIYKYISTEKIDSYLSELSEYEFEENMDGDKNFDIL